MAEVEAANPAAAASANASPTYLATGGWAFASGCQHADWLFGNCAITTDGQPLPGPLGPDGPPQLRCVALPAHEWADHRHLEHRGPARHR